MEQCLFSCPSFDKASIFRTVDQSYEGTKINVMYLVDARSWVGPLVEQPGVGKKDRRRRVLQSGLV